MKFASLAECPVDLCTRSVAAVVVIRPCGVPVMDLYSKQQLYLLSVLCAFGSVLTQVDIHLVCPSDVWEPGYNYTLQCFVKKTSYPSKCVTTNGEDVKFGHNSDRYKAYPTVCALSDIRGNCDSTGDCRCGTGNATHYLFEYEFTASNNTEGYWDCSMSCFNGAVPLTFRQSDCDYRKVYAIPEDLTDELKDQKNTTYGLIGGCCCAVAGCGGIAGYHVYYRKKAKSDQAKKSDTAARSDQTNTSGAIKSDAV